MKDLPDEPTQDHFDNVTPSAASNNCWVFKLGGSLLNQPNLAERLRFVISQISTKPLLIVGGGPAANIVQIWDHIHRLTPTDAHWLAIRAMEFNLHLVESLLPEAVEILHQNEMAGIWSQERIPVLNAYDWLRRDEDQPDSLPHSWDVTSDSIAAHIALRVGAEGLALLKSVAAPSSILELLHTENDFVDAFFSQLVTQLPGFAWCDFLSNPMTITRFRMEDE